MKLLISILLSCFCFFSVQAQVHPNRNGYVHPLVSTVGATPLTSVNIQNTNGHGIVYVITQNTGSWLLNQDTGMTFINATGKKIIITGGVGSENCKDVSILGYGSDSAYGFEFRGGQVTANFQGMQNNILIEGCRFTGGVQGPFWMKEEAPHACDYYNYWQANGTPAQKLMYGQIASYLAPNFQDNIIFRHNAVDSSGGDFYCGSTGGIDGRDQVPCLGNSTPPTMQLHNIHVDSNYFNYLGRSVQISVATGGTNTLNDNLMTNLGYEWAETGSPTGKSQGGCRFGSGDVNMEVSRNSMIYSNLYNYDLEEPNINFHDNYGAYSDVVIYHGVPIHGGQALANVMSYASHPQINPLKIQYNTMEFSTASGGINYAIYGGNNFTRPDNIVCGNNGNVQVLSLPFNYTTVCTGQDTTCVTRDTSYFVDADTTFHFDSTFRDSIGQVTKLSYIDTVVHKNRSFTVRQHFNKPVDTTYRVLVRAAYDSIGICSLCKLLDTTYQKCAFPTTTYGSFLTPTDSTTTLASRIHLNKAYNCPAMRDNWMFGSPYQVQQYKDSGLLVYCMVGTSDNTIPTNQQALADTITTRLNQSTPYILGYLNEASGGYTGTAQDYIAGLTTITPICHARNVLVCNGGFTQDICYPMLQYYTQRGYDHAPVDSVGWLQGIFGNTLNLNGSTAIAKLAFYNVVLPYIRSSTLDFVDYHIYTQPYLADSLNTTLNAFIPISTGFIMNQTLKPVISSEFGERKEDAVVTNGSLTQFKQTQPAWLIFYPNRGTYAYPNEQAWKTFVLNNP